MVDGGRDDRLFSIRLPAGRSGRTDLQLVHPSIRHTYVVRPIYRRCISFILRSDTGGLMGRDVVTSSWTINLDDVVRYKMCLAQLLSTRAL